jgi:hypothetical protein
MVTAGTASAIGMITTMITIATTIATMTMTTTDFSLS